MTRKIDTRHKVIGGRHRAMSRYYMICNRTKNTGTSRNKNYQGVNVLVEMEDFVEWFMPKDFAGCSVDRIDKNKHYELENMQVISLAKNIAKDKLISKDGICRCFMCKQIKPIDDFTTDRRRQTTGKSTCCKYCDSNRKSNESSEARERRRAREAASYQARKQRSTGHV